MGKSAIIPYCSVHGHCVGLVVNNGCVADVPHIVELFCVCGGHAFVSACDKSQVVVIITVKIIFLKSIDPECGESGFTSVAIACCRNVSHYDCLSVRKRIKCVCEYECGPIQKIKLVASCSLSYSDVQIEALLSGFFICPPLPQFFVS